MTRTQHWLVGGLFVLAVIAYYLPWGWHPDAGLSPGGRDLAEWTTLHPETRTANPALLPSFLLRAAQGWLAALIAWWAFQIQQRPARWAMQIAAILMAVSLCPPLEFFTVARADPNYQQQFALCALTLTLTTLLLVRGNASPDRVRHAGAVVLSLSGAGCGIFGLTQGLRVLNSLGVSIAVGSGGVLFVGALAVAGLLYLYTWRQGRQAQRQN